MLRWNNVASRLVKTFKINMKFIKTLILTILPFIFNAQNVNWTFENKSFNAGDTVEVKFRVTNFTDIGAFQYTLKFDTSKLNLKPTNKVTFTGALAGYGTNCFTFAGPGYALKAWEIRTAWLSTTGKTLSANTHTHSLWFIAKKSGTVCNSLQLHFAAPLWPNAWKSNLAYVPLTVLCAEPAPFKSKFTSEREETEFKIYPNPFVDVINVSEPRFIKVIDLSGKLILSENVEQNINIDVPKGIYFVLVDNKAYKLVKQ